MKSARSLDELERRIGIKISDHGRLERALTHSSLRTPAKGRGKGKGKKQAGESPRSYERLEFLGDRVLGLVVAEKLFDLFPGADEGELALRLNALVNSDTCAAIADEIGLYDFVRHGGDLKTLKDDRTKSIRADLTESLIAAIYLGDGLEAARHFIVENWAERLAGDVSARRDAKTALQEWAHTKSAPVPNYEIVERSGPDHDPVFTVRVSVEGFKSGDGKGRSKRLAEQEAAERILLREGVWTEEN